MAFVVAVKILHLSAIERGGFDVVGGADALVLDRSLGHVAKLELHLRPQVTGGVVIGVGYNVKLAVHHDGLALLDITGSHEFLVRLTRLQSGNGRPG